MTCCYGLFLGLFSFNFNLKLKYDWNGQIPIVLCGLGHSYHRHGLHAVYHTKN